MATQLTYFYVANGSQRRFSFNFPYNDTKDIKVSLDLEESGNWSISGSSVVFQVAPKAGTIVEISRWTSTVPFARATGGAFTVQYDVALAQLQPVRVAEEAFALLDGVIVFAPELNAWTARGRPIANVGIAVKDTDAVPLKQLLAYIGGAGIRKADPAALAAALAQLELLLVLADDVADFEAAMQQLRDIYAALLLIIEQLRGYANDPPPHGADLIQRIDDFLGQTLWRFIEGSNQVEEFNSSGTWTKPEETAYDFILVECWGGGGPGAPFNRLTCTIETGGGTVPAMPGGGGGGYARALLHLDDLPDTVAVTVGNGGSAATTLGSCTNGGTSSFGAYVEAYGGAKPASHYSGGRGGSPLPNGEPLLEFSPKSIQGEPGFVVEDEAALNPADDPVGGLFHGGGGGSGFAPSSPSATVSDPAMRGAPSLLGGGGGGGGTTESVSVSKRSAIMPVFYPPKSVYSNVSLFQAEWKSHYVIPVKFQNDLVYWLFPPFGDGVNCEQWGDTSGFTTKTIPFDYRSSTSYNAARVAALNETKTGRWQLAGAARNSRRFAIGFTLIDITETGPVAFDRYGTIIYAPPGWKPGTASGGSQTSTGLLPRGPGGVSLTGGNGGDGGLIGQEGRPGRVPGGGGGGAGIPTISWNTSNIRLRGGAGGKGRVKITYL